MDTKPCLECGETFVPLRQFADGRGGKFCSRSCQQKDKRRMPSPTPTNCGVCGVTFTPGKTYTDGRGKICSLACRQRRRRDDGRSSLAQRKSLLRRKYGVTLDQYWEMHEAQGGACAICGRTDPVGRCAAIDPMWLAVDHDHDTGRVRGLLCMHCNTALGQFNHDPKIMQAAMSYLADSNSIV